MNISNRINYISLHIKKIGLFTSASYFFQRVFKSKNELIKIQLRGLAEPIYLRNKSYDVYIFYQIFINEDLKINYEGKIETVLDCGANIGLSTLYFKREYPLAQIISIEPEDDNFLLLQKNVKNYSTISCIKTGVYDSDCNLYLVDIGKGEASYRVLKNPGEYKVIKVIECRGLNNIIYDLKKTQIDVLKMDIEGSEYECFLSPNQTWIDKCRYILVEIHEYMHPGINSDIDDLMKSFLKTNKGEYTIFKSVSL